MLLDPLDRVGTMSKLVSYATTGMSFVATELYDIISIVGDIIFMGDDENPQIDIQTNCDANPDGDLFDLNTAYCQLSCPVKHGRIEIQVHAKAGKIAYYGAIDRLLQEVDFNYESISDRSGSFQSALRTILKTDRENTIVASLERIFELS
jgi:hypothetical protein